MASGVNGPTKTPFRAQHIHYTSSCCVCLRAQNLVDISDSYRIRQVLSNDLKKYVQNTIYYLCSQCCMVLQMCSRMEEWDQALEMFASYYRSKCPDVLEDYTSSAERRKWQRTYELSKLRAAKRRLFED